MKLTKIYESILLFSGLAADSEGFISTVLDDRREPALINGLRLVLPTDNQLRTANPKEKIFFHPLNENILRGESEVIKKLLEVINIRLNFTFGIIGQSLLNIVLSVEDHHKLNPDQMELVLLIKEIDEITLRNFVNIMLEGIKQKPDGLFSNIFLKRGGSIDGRRYSRIGVVIFPAFDELIKDTNEVYGVKLRNKDKVALKELYKYIYPQVENRTYYNRGSDSDVAPYIDALMKTALGLASRFNDILNLYNGFIEESDNLIFDSDWVEAFENLNVLVPEIRKIPMQSGNEGSIKTGDESHSTIVHPKLPVPSAVSAQTAKLQPTQSETAVMPNMITQRPTQVVKTPSGKLDFNSLKTMNPGIGFMPNPLVNTGWMQMQPMMQMQPPPMWSGGLPPMQSGMMNPVMMNPAMMQPVMMNPAMMQPAMMQPAMMQPAMMQPSMMQPSMMPTGAYLNRTV